MSNGGGTNTNTSHGGGGNGNGGIYLKVDGSTPLTGIWTTGNYGINLGSGTLAANNLSATSLVATNSDLTLSAGLVNRSINITPSGTGTVKVAAGKTLKVDTINESTTNATTVTLANTGTSVATNAVLISSTNGGVAVNGQSMLIETANGTTIDGGLTSFGTFNTDAIHQASTNWSSLEISNTGTSTNNAAVAISSTSGGVTVTPAAGKVLTVGGSGISTANGSLFAYKSSTQAVTGGIATRMIFQEGMTIGALDGPSFPTGELTTTGSLFTNTSTRTIHLLVVLNAWNTSNNFSVANGSQMYVYNTVSTVQSAVGYYQNASQMSATAIMTLAPNDAIECIIYSGTSFTLSNTNRTQVRMYVLKQ